MHIVDHIRAVFLLAAALLLIPPASAYSGQLGDFEKDATKPNQENKRPSTSSTAEQRTPSEAPSSDPGAELAGALVQGMFELVGAALAEGGAESWLRIGMDRDGIVTAGTGSRKSGEALLPFVRLDTLYQDVQGDVSATDVRFELGYGPLGAQIRRTVFDEKDPLESMEVTELCFLYRMSAGDHWEIDLGLGEMTLSGLQDNTGILAVVPILFHPSESFGIEVRPSWSSINENTIQDMDVAFVFGMRYVSIKAGYRSLKSPHQALRGPEIGLAMRW